MKCETGKIHAKKRYSSGFIMIYTVTVSLFGLTPDCGKHQVIGGVPIPQEFHLSVVRPHCLRRFYSFFMPSSRNSLVLIVIIFDLLKIIENLKTRKP